MRSRIAFPREGFVKIRYEIEVGLDAKSREIGLNHEMLTLLADPARITTLPPISFPETINRAGSIFKPPGSRGDEVVIHKIIDGIDLYYSEIDRIPPSNFRLGKTRSALANIPADEEAFPLILWFRELLEAGVQNLTLDSQKIRQPGPPGSGTRYQADGSNLPWVIAELQKKPKRFQMWLEHVRTALEDIESVDTVERK